MFRSSGGVNIARKIRKICTNNKADIGRVQQRRKCRWGDIM